MKNRSKRLNLSFITAILVVIFLTNCASRIKYTIESKKVKEIKTTVLLETIIEKPETQTFPLIDAAIFNSTFNGKAEKITEYEKTIIDQFQKALADRINKNFSLAVTLPKDVPSLAKNKIRRLLPRPRPASNKFVPAIPRQPLPRYCS